MEEFAPMASAKKAKKSRKTTPKRSKAARPSRIQRSLENVETPEELLQKLDAASAEHDVEVRKLGTALFRAIEKFNFHPTVVLDTLQVLLSEGIGVALGDEQQELFNAHIRAYHQDSRMLSVASMLGVTLADLTADSGSEPSPEADPAATELGGPNDYAQKT
jgi:hypothetical protein